MFELGQVVFTKEIKYALEKNKFSNSELLKCLILHTANISDSCEEDRNYNLQDINDNCGSVLNKYNIDDTYPIFIHTYLGECNQTTIMFTHEY